MITHARLHCWRSAVMAVALLSVSLVGGEERGSVASRLANQPPPPMAFGSSQLYVPDLGLCPDVPAQPSNPNYDQKRLLAGHLLRRIGFGPTQRDLNEVLQKGWSAYVEEQLHPGSIDDSEAEKKLPPRGKNYYDDYSWMRRWYTRMLYSRRQLREKMTLIWHEHFATSNEKVSSGCWMHAQEEFLRLNSLGSFRDLLIGITKDQAMLVYLDNDPNNGQATDDDGNPVPPNENYARELMQLFSLGTARLNMDGSPITDADGVPVPAYTEDDVKAVARALTGWYTRWGKCGVKAGFYPPYHDPNDKRILGETIKGRKGKEGSKEVAAVVDIIMKQPSVAPFISKMLIQKLATETPTPEYVGRVATVFAQTRGDIRAVVRAIVLDSEFTSEAVVRTQFKEPIEQFVGALRAIGAHARGDALIWWTYYAGQLIYYPPSVFSFYPPGNKAALINTALVTIRDRVAEEMVNGTWDTWFDPEDIIKKKKLKTPEQAVDYLADVMLTAPLETPVRTRLIQYMNGRVTDEKFRGLVWLMLCSPEFQRN